MDDNKQFESISMADLVKSSTIDHTQPVYFVFFEPIAVRINPLDYLEIIGTLEVEEKEEVQTAYFSNTPAVEHTRDSPTLAALLAMTVDTPRITGNDDVDEITLKTPVTRYLTLAQMAEANASGHGFTLMNWENADKYLAGLYDYLDECERLRQSVHRAKVPPEEDIAKLTALSERLRPIVDVLHETNKVVGVNSKLDSLFLKIRRSNSTSTS